MYFSRKSSGSPDEPVVKVILYSEAGSSDIRQRGTLSPTEGAAMHFFIRLTVQPDVQYVIHPGGTRATRNAVVPGLRIAVAH
jgi:carbohydrate-selective porin OprB